MVRLLRPFWCLGALGWALLFTVDAHAYAMKIHEELTQRTLPSDAWLLSPSTTEGAGSNSLRRFQVWLYEQAKQHPDMELRSRFLARYPTVHSFSSRAFRRLLAFNQSPRTRLWSIERAHPGARHNARSLLATSSADPDRDGRNRDRVEYEEQTGRIIKNAAGEPIPDDPSILNMGRATGLSSQAHAHYGLRNVTFSDDPQTLKDDPDQFAVSAGYPEGPILTTAAEMTQLHTDLAVLAALWGGPGNRYLTLTFVGQAFHYLEDLGNQIHTVQVGLYDFFVDAKLQYWYRAFLTSGGYLAELKPFTSIGVDILRNHHVLIEQLTAKRFAEALAGRSESAAFEGLPQALTEDEPALAGMIDAALASRRGPAAFAEILARTLTEVSAPEGGQAYGYIRTVACGRLRNYGFQVPDDTDSRMLDPDSLICHPEEMGALEALYDLQVRAFQRVGTALRRYDRELSLLLQEPASGERTELILGRFLRDRLDALDASEARKAAWLAQPQSQTTSLVTSPAWPAAQLVSIVLILLWFRWRSRQSQILASTEEAAA